jgi:hypothetical protein
MCAAAGKLWGHYRALGGTEKFLEELASDIGITISELIQSVRGGSGSQGTWVHPQIAIDLAQWLSPRFRVQVSKWVFEWMDSQSKAGIHRLPYHLQRYVTNQHNVPVGHFSILVEMTQTLIAPLEACGVEVPEHVWPDISQGRMFCDWLRKNGYNPDAFPTYRHDFSDGRKAVYPKAYPIELLGSFRLFLQNDWMPNRMPKYLAEKVPEALPFMARLLPPRPANAQLLKRGVA